jgi:hypothetical protein
MTVALVTQSRAHTRAARGLDLYETPPEAVRALLRVENLPFRIWEPAAGRGAIARVLRDAGHEVTTSDISSGADFFRAVYPPVDAPHGIVTNPPFQHAARFVAHAITMGTPYVAMLLRWSFWEGGTGPRPEHVARRFVLDDVPPARAYCFANRLPMMHRDGWTGPRAAQAMAFGWFIWERPHRRITNVRRIRWRPRADTSQTPAAPTS